jgi:hypothetical protein
MLIEQLKTQHKVPAVPRLLEIRKTQLDHKRLKILRRREYSSCNCSEDIYVSTFSMPKIPSGCRSNPVSVSKEGNSRTFRFNRTNGRVGRSAHILIQDDQSPKTATSNFLSGLWTWAVGALAWAKLEPAWAVPEFRCSEKFRIRKRDSRKFVQNARRVECTAFVVLCCLLSRKLSSLEITRFPFRECSQSFDRKGSSRKD